MIEQNYNNKYYPPTYDEFHSGFEYEIYVPDGLNWRKETFYLNINHLDLIKFNNTRVKYLDDSDIISLGWLSTKYNNYYTMQPSGNLGVWVDVILDMRWGVKDVIIKGVRGNEDDILFRGVVKNKSELKRLMKQLNII